MSWAIGVMVCVWHKRLSLPVPEAWEKVLAKLSPLPVEEDVYITYEGIPDMWTNFAFEHPALIGTFGMLPGDGVDQATLARTLAKIDATWNYDRTWGWDFPMLAMAAGAVNPIKRSTSCSIRQVGSSLMNMGWQQAALSLISRLTVLC